MSVMVVWNGPVVTPPEYPAHNDAFQRQSNVDWVRVGHSTKLSK